MKRAEEQTGPRGLPFPSPYLLAPMEGVTGACFRELVLERNSPEHLGGVFTEFQRVTDAPLAAARLRAELRGAARFRPLGIQLMGQDPATLAESARAVRAAGAALVDLNLGCPSRRARHGRAGSFLLDDPSEVETLVRCLVEAVPGLPVSAKMRAGGESDALLEELACAVQAGGASMLTVHCRTRDEGYRDSADWERLRRAVRAVTIPVCGNGGVERHADLERLRRETGCALVMVGRAALADPWIFCGRRVERGEAARFLVDYMEGLMRDEGWSAERAAGRLKELLRFWKAGALVGDEAGRAFERGELLRERDPDHLLERLRSALCPGRAGGALPSTPGPRN